MVEACPLGHGSGLLATIGDRTFDFSHFLKYCNDLTQVLQDASNLRLTGGTGGKSKNVKQWFALVSVKAR